MNALSMPGAGVTRDDADRTIGAAIVAIATYLTITLWPMLRYASETRELRPLVAHGVVLATAVALLRAHSTRWQRARDLLPLVVGAFLYVELRWLIPGLGRPHADALIQHWELALFPGNPAAAWALSMPSRPLSEVLHFAYASYYLLVLVPPLVLYARHRRAAYADTMLAYVVVYGLCFAVYLILPVDGPRYLVGPAAAPDGPVRTFVLRLLEAGSSRGTAFPSSHVAASVVATLCAMRYQRRIGVVTAVLTVGLALGTVYGGFHYAVDALAGGVTGLGSWLAASALCRALSTPGAQRASAA